MSYQNPLIKLKIYARGMLIQNFLILLYAFCRSRPFEKKCEMFGPHESAQGFYEKLFEGN